MSESKLDAYERQVMAQRAKDLQDSMHVQGISKSRSPRKGSVDQQSGTDNKSKSPKKSPAKKIEMQIQEPGTPPVAKRAPTPQGPLEIVAVSKEGGK